MRQTGFARNQRPGYGPQETGDVLFSRVAIAHWEAITYVGTRP
jgi:hypothetical protein